MVPDSPDVREVLAGDGGVFDNAKPGTLVIDFSSHPTRCHRRAGRSRRRARASGCSTPRSPAARPAPRPPRCRSWSAARPTTSRPPPRSSTPVGKTIVHVGPSGAGQTVKAANQLIVAGNIQVLAEALVFLEAYGVDTEAAMEVLGGGLAGSAVLDQKRQNMLNRDFKPGFRIDLHHKDMGIVTAAAREAGVIIPLGAVLAQLMGSARGQRRRRTGPLRPAARCRCASPGRTRTRPRPAPPAEDRNNADHARRRRRRRHPGEGRRRHQSSGCPGRPSTRSTRAMRDHGGIKHILARHVEGASHMAEGYTRAKAGNIGVCIGTSGPAGTDMITGLYSASADSIPILCITGQAPVARLHKEDFQAVDIADIATPLDEDGDDRAGAGPGAGRVPAGVPPDALRPARPGPARPAVRRADGRDRVRSRHLRAAARRTSRRPPGPRRPRRWTCWPRPSAR